MRAETNEEYERLAHAESQRTELAEAVTPADLYHRHSGDVHKLLLALLRDRTHADDVLQQVFLKLLAHWDTIRHETAKNWLFTVAYREALTLRRRLCRNEAALQKLWQRPAWDSDDTCPQKRAAVGDDVNQIRKALAALTEEQREVVERRIYKDQTFKEIAKHMNSPLGTVLTRMRLALKKIKQLVETGDVE